jgi:predicted HicB family RNase H-like nuclease
MEPGEPREALAGTKPRRSHPAAPDAVVKAREAVAASGGSSAADRLVMLCVRVPASLRKRVKVAAIQGGRSVQELATEALEAECRRRGV